MISNRQFWRTWPTSQKSIVFLLFSLFILLTVALLFWYFNNPGNTLHWNLATELNKEFVAKEAFTANGLRFTNNELIYYLKEWFIPSDQNLAPLPGLLLVMAMALGMSLSLTALSYKNGLWFLAGLVGLAGFVLSLRLEIVFQKTSNLPFLIAFFTWGSLYFVFNSFFRKASFLLRLGSFLLVSGLIICSGIWSHKLAFPVFAMAGYALIFAIVIFAIFVFTVAHEGMALVVKAVSSAGEKGKSSLVSYFMLSGFYLLNCLLIYLENTRLIDHSLFVIDPVWLLIFSTGLGFWGFRDQSETLGWFSYRESGFWLYAGLALISLALPAYAYATGNDPLYELLNDYIAICHLTLGLIFFVHVLINFIALFRQGLRVDLLLYKPKFSRLILAKTAGIAIIGFLLIQKNIYSYNQLEAAQANAKADFYLKEGEKTAAETFYKESVKFDMYNHKGNFALGQMAAAVGDGVTASYYFKRANQKNATEFSYAALSRYYESEDLFFDALFNLREGLQKFPESPALLTNMAVMMEKAGVTDSVYFYLNEALEHCRQCETENTNMLAFWIENGRPEKLDSVALPYLGTSSTSQAANSLAVSRMTGLTFDPQIAEPKTAGLSTADFALLYNQTLNNPKSTRPDSIWNALSEEMISARLSQDVLFLKANDKYTHEDKITAIKQLTYLAQDSTETGLMYRRTLGMWYLQEGVYDRSVKWLLASGDAASANLMSEMNFPAFLDARQKQQAEELLQKELTLENYKEIYNSAPFNPYLVVKIAGFLEKKDKINEAYTLVFDTLEFNERSAILWQKQVLLALKNGVMDYAQNGLDRLEKLMPADEFKQFESQVREEQGRLAEMRTTF